jgi:hypothetical protein
MIALSLARLFRLARDVRLHFMMQAFGVGQGVDDGFGGSGDLGDDAFALRLRLCRLVGLLPGSGPGCLLRAGLRFFFAIADFFFALLADFLRAFFAIGRPSGYAAL